MKINLKQFALSVSTEMELSQKDAEHYVRSIFEILAEEMAEGHEVTIPGFGKFRRKDKAARQARNPKTGEIIDVPAKSVPNFLPAKQLKEQCNGS